MSPDSDQHTALVYLNLFGFYHVDTCYLADMGGTSTDVSRYDGHLEHVFETTTAGVVVQAPQLDIHTVAAGGGSRLFLRRGLFVVGPESSGAHPGPVCYRKGGYLSVTDANLVLGRIIPECFPCIFGPKEDQPLDLQAARNAFAAVAKEPEAGGRTVDELAYGFLQVANEVSDSVTSLCSAFDCS